MKLDFFFYMFIFMPHQNFWWHVGPCNSDFFKLGTVLTYAFNEHKYVISLVCHVLNGLKAPEGLNSFGFCDKKARCLNTWCIMCVKIMRYEYVFMHLLSSIVHLHKITSTLSPAYLSFIGAHNIGINNTCFLTHHLQRNIYIPSTQSKQTRHLSIIFL